MEEEPKLQNLEEDDTKSQSLEEHSLKGSKSQSLEENPTSQSTDEGDPKSRSLKADSNSQIMEEADSKSQSLKEDHKSLSLEENHKSLSLEEEPKSLSLEGRDKIAFSGFNENSLQFLDSIDCAQHSMGASHVSSALLDLKSHNASTFLQVTQQSNRGAEQIHRFTLRKWASSNNEDGAPLMNMSPQIPQRKDKDGSPPPFKAEPASTSEGAD
ncbi:hypothetical protein C1H46_044371 [Malus baccata]|uniref:Vacuolar ATPase assembly protein VMA22 n=1 Tax=Malus baccata TaxID=106549 RepID=A0A540K786_MALBA|nr:hypothetical protein C1H46_044371 [Malus baccata]